MCDLHVNECNWSNQLKTLAVVVIWVKDGKRQTEKEVLIHLVMQLIALTIHFFTITNRASAQASKPKCEKKQIKMCKKMLWMNLFHVEESVWSCVLYTYSTHTTFCYILIILLNKQVWTFFSVSYFSLLHHFKCDLLPISFILSINCCSEDGEKRVKSARGI